MIKMNNKTCKYLNYKNIALITILLLIASFAFSTEINAQIIRAHIGIGVTTPVRVEPEHHNYVSVVVGPRRYYYDEGAFYVRARGGYTVVAAPIGARIRVLPAGYVSVRIGGADYYYYNGVYYTYLPDQETYVVVERPANADNTADMKFDRVKLYDGSIVEGVFQGATDSYITLKVGDHNRDINISEIVSITFAPTLNN
jgi:hypothetical protein